MSSNQSQRLREYCMTIWGGNDNYEFDCQTDDYEYYQIFVEREESRRLCPLTGTSVCRGEQMAWNYLERMLRAWATQAATGKPLTKEQKLEIFGGPQGELRNVLQQVDEALKGRLL